MGRPQKVKRVRRPAFGHLLFTLLSGIKAQVKSGHGSGTIAVLLSANFSQAALNKLY
jgi:hypothetical protein